MHKHQYIEDRVSIQDLMDSVLTHSFTTRRQRNRQISDDISGGVLSVIPGMQIEDVAWAQYSAIHDERTCGYCSRLDGMILSVDNEDYISGRYDPPQHWMCRCQWIKISRTETGVEENWNPPSEDELDVFRENPQINRRTTQGKGWSRLRQSLSEDTDLEINLMYLFDK